MGAEKSSSITIQSFALINVVNMQIKYLPVCGSDKGPKSFTPAINSVKIALLLSLQVGYVISSDIATNDGY